MFFRSPALRRIPVVLATAALVATGTTAMAAEPPAEGTVVGADRADAVAGSYIVTLTDTTRRADVARLARSLAGQFGGAVGHTYTAALRGFQVSMDEDAARRLAAHPSVARVEADGTARATATQNNPPSWGLDRVDQRNLPLDKKYTYPNTASNVTAYVLDTGIRFSHSDFGGRARSGYDFIDNDSNASDCHGHGTHVSGTVGGAKHGVAKGAKLVGVRVLNCSGSGTWSQIIAGIDWVTDNASGPAVANMSLGGGKNQSVNDAVTRSINSGVSYALAAGNDNGANACNTSPASTPAAITLGATQSNDSRASYSNVGSCLDLFAPGSGITSAWHTSDTATNSISGTSMATPHAAGAAALLLSANPGWSPQQVRDRLVSNATTGKVGNPGSGSPNRLLFVSNG